MPVVAPEAGAPAVRDLAGQNSQAVEAVNSAGRPRSAAGSSALGYRPPLDSPTVGGLMLLAAVDHGDQYEESDA
jgi:hypothetical protein